MRKKPLAALFFLSSIVTVSNAQIRVPVMPGLNPEQGNLYHPPATFKHSVNVFIGYGFPNVDQNYVPRYEHMTHGNISQAGPLIAALDYQFSKRVSVGALITRGIVSTPYYDQSSPPEESFMAKFYNWSFMVDVVRYIPVNQKVFPYIRTAIGMNLWKQDYTANNGDKASVTPISLPYLSYQVGIGAKFIVLKNAGVFIEAGYGKYVFNGGLSVRF